MARLYSKRARRAARIAPTLSVTYGQGHDVQSRKREEPIDITAEVAQIVRASGIANGIVSVYAQGATAAPICRPGLSAHRRRSR